MVSKHNACIDHIRVSLCIHLDYSFSWGYAGVKKAKLTKRRISGFAAYVYFGYSFSGHNISNMYLPTGPMPVVWCYLFLSFFVKVEFVAQRMPVRIMAGGGSDSYTFGKCGHTSTTH